MINLPRYIHQLEDWPAFRWDHARIDEPLATVRHQQGRLLGRLEGLGFDLKKQASFETLTQDVLKTSEIEGEFLNPDAVRSSLARHLGIERSALKPADRHVEGVVEMLLDATQNYKQSLTAERLFGWHAALFPDGWSGTHKIKTGCWRQGSVDVVSGRGANEKVHFEGPPAEIVSREMQEFMRWFEDAAPLDLVLKAGIAHLWFVTIHPFDDGNGRIARALADMMLARSEDTEYRFYSMSAQIRAEHRQYYEALEITQKGSLDVTEWLYWFLTCLNRAIAGAHGIVGSVLVQAKFWQSLAVLSINDRQRSVLKRLLDGFEGKLTSSKWAKLAKCSQDTAHRDIMHLVAQGILVKDSAGGRSTSYSLMMPESS